MPGPVTHPIAALAAGHGNPRPYDSVQVMQANAAKQGVAIQPRFLRAPEDPEISPAKDSAPWQLRSGRTRPVINSTEKLRPHQPIGTVTTHHGSTHPKGTPRTPTPTKHRTARFSSVREIEDSRSPHDKRVVAITRLERAKRAEFESEELAKVRDSRNHYSVEQLRVARTEAKRRANIRAKKWRDAVDAGEIEIPWQLVDTPVPSPQRKTARRPPGSAKAARGNGSTRPPQQPAGSSPVTAPAAAAAADPVHPESDPEQDPEPEVGPLTTAHLSLIFDEVDANHDGVVTVDELFDAVQNNPVVQQVIGFTSNMSPDKEAKFARLFAAIDENHNDEITLEEFEHYMFNEGGVQQSVDDTQPMSDEEVALRKELAQLQLFLLGKQHDLAKAVHSSIDVLPAERVKVKSLEGMLEEEGSALNTYARKVKQLQTIEAASGRA